MMKNIFIKGYDNEFQKSKPQKRVWKKPFFLINSGLALLLLSFIILRLYKVQVIIDSSFGSKPLELIKILEDSLPTLPKSDINIVFVFNSLPSGTQVDSLEKLHKNVGSKANIVALFNKTFRTPFIITYPHYF